MFTKLIKSLPLQLLLCIIFAFVFGKYLSFDVIKSLYTISSLLKEILMVALPIIVFSYIFAAILLLEKSAPLLIFTILAFVVISNALVAFSAYGIGMSILPFLSLENANQANTIHGMTSYFSLEIPKIISSDKAMLSGLILGSIFCYFNVPRVNRIADKLQNYVTIFLTKAFVPFLPLYVLGFILKLQYEGSLEILFKSYAQVFGLICLSIICYIFLMYLIASKFCWKTFVESVKHMTAPGLTGFSTICSAVTMPLTIIATEKNTNNPQFTRLVISTTLNIHMIGHGLSIPITSLAILILSGHPLPSLEAFSIFVAYFCLAKFSATAVPGGGIIVILPILQNQLGFTPEMASLIIMLDILQDAVLTSANVMGNGALAMLCYRFCRFLGFIESDEELEAHEEAVEIKSI